MILQDSYELNKFILPCQTFVVIEIPFNRHISNPLSIPLSYSLSLSLYSLSLSLYLSLSLLLTLSDVQAYRIFTHPRYWKQRQPPGFFDEYMKNKRNLTVKNSMYYTDARAFGRSLENLVPDICGGKACLSKSIDVLQSPLLL